MTTTNDEKYNKIMREYHEFLKKQVEEVEHGDEIQPDDYNPFGEVEHGDEIQPDDYNPCGEVEKPKRPKRPKGVIPAWAR